MENKKITLKNFPLFAAAALAAMVLAIGGVAFAQSSGITDHQAREIALRAVPGEVIELEREDDEIEVLIRATDGRLMEVEIDSQTGRITEIENEDEEEGEDDDDD